jgi:DNA topoisomerase I
VRMDRNRFIPEDKGRLVTTFLTNFFERYVEYGFTADLEERLDEISEGKLDWKQLMRDFWRDFSAAVGETKDLKISEVIDALDKALGPHIFPPNADGSDPRVCPTCSTGTLSLKLGRFGAFIGCSNYPDCRYTRQLGQSAEEAGNGGPKGLGVHPDTGEEISLRSGRFGPYFQLGEGEKPKRAGLPKGVSPADATLDLAIKLLSLPREIGIHPELQKPIVANSGRFGPYVSCDGQYASLENFEEMFTIGINRAVTLLAEKKARGRSFRGPEPLKELGDGENGAKIKLMKGRYGPYVTDGEVNATVPKEKNPLEITLDEAKALIAERAAKGPSKKKQAKKKAAPKKAKTDKPKAEKVTTGAKPKAKKTVKKKAAPKKSKK